MPESKTTNKAATKRPTKTERELKRYKKQEIETAASYERTIEKTRTARIIIHEIASSKSFKNDIGNLKSYEYVFYKETLKKMREDLEIIFAYLDKLEKQIKELS